MGNQQERSLAWLAGVLEAEGSISVQVYTLPDGRVRLTPYLCVVNTDRVLLEEVRRILSDLVRGEEKALPRWCGHGGTNRPCWTLRLDGVAVAKALEALYPYMVGEKRRNAEVVLRYVEGRKNSLLVRGDGGRIKRAGYTKEEVELVCSIRSHKSAKSSETICQAPNVMWGVGQMENPDFVEAQRHLTARYRKMLEMI